MSIATVHAEVQMPAAELDGFLRILREWDAGRTETRVALKIDAPGRALDDLGTIFARLTPPLPYVDVVPRSAVEDALTIAAAVTVPFQQARARLARDEPPRLDALCALVTTAVYRAATAVLTTRSR